MKPSNLPLQTRLLSILVFSLVFSVSMSAKAAITVNVWQSTERGRLISRLQVSGSIDLTGLNLVATGVEVPTSGLNPTAAYLYINSGKFDVYSNPFANMIVSPEGDNKFFRGGDGRNFSQSGDAFAVDLINSGAQYLGVPEGYSSGQEISAFGSWNTPFTYLYQVEGTTQTLIVGSDTSNTITFDYSAPTASSVPEPSSLFLCVLPVVGFLVRRKRD